MNTREQLDKLCLAMMAHDQTNPRRIQHFLKVSAFATLIGRQEGADEHTLFILEAAGYVHDIGCRVAMEKYGHQNGQLQQELGPAAAEPMLQSLGFTAPDIDRLCWLIAHHHTYTHIDTLDHQILVEADFLVNLYEHQSPMETIEQTEAQIFRTEAGKRILRTMFVGE